jgi:hypothetical protein
LFGVQGCKVIYNKIFTDVQYNLIPVSSYDDIKRVTFKSFGAYGKKLDNKKHQIYSYAHYHNIVINNLVDILQ